MRILHIYKDYPPILGGIENHVQLLAQGQAAAGHAFACRSGSLPSEVAGDPADGIGFSAALLVDPLDTAALADALRLVLTDDGLRAELRRRGLARAARFTWQQTAVATLAIYRQEAHRRE